jgi:hypothetical protein
MRTTVTIDPDVEVLLRKAMRQRGEPFKQVLNAAIRNGLRGGLKPPAVAAFSQRTFNMGKPLVDLTNALVLASELDDAQVLARARRRAAK